MNTDTVKKQTESEQFTPSQKHALHYFIATSSVAEGAREAKVSKKQACEWFKNPAFKKAVALGKEEIFTEALLHLKSAAGEAVATLLEIMHTSKDERTRLSAAEKVLGYGFRAKETYDLETRLATIEETLSKEKL